MCKISIIIPSFNSSKTIKDTFDSIFLQKIDEIESYLIDGLSKDNSIDIVKLNFKECKIISEKDNGIYDAMNKGIHLATGDIIGILNSDDFYYDETVLETVSKAFEDPSIDIVYGNLVYVDQDDTTKIKRVWKNTLLSKKDWRKGLHPAHPTFFVRKSVYEKYGTFNLDFKIAADYELMLRLLYKHNLKAKHIDKFFVKMRLGGESNSSLKNILLGNRERKKAWKINGLKYPYFFFLKNFIIKSKQYISKDKGL